MVKKYHGNTMVRYGFTMVTMVYHGAVHLHHGKWSGTFYHGLPWYKCIPPQITMVQVPWYFLTRVIDTPGTPPTADLT
jgi:hypothetical protein